MMCFFLLQETYKVDMVFYVDEIVQVLSEQFKGSGKPRLYLLHGLNTDSGNLSKPASFEVSAFSSFLLHLIIKILLIYWQSYALVIWNGCLLIKKFWDFDVHSVFLIFEYHVCYFLTYFCVISGD